MVSQFELTVGSDDFHAVLSLAEPLYLHSCHILSLLPSTDSVQPQKVSQETFLDGLPLCFTRSQALQASTRFGISPGTLDSAAETDDRQGSAAERRSGRIQVQMKNPSECEFHLPHTRICVCVGVRAPCKICKIARFFFPTGKKIFPTWILILPSFFSHQSFNFLILSF